ncbi:MAG: hypothetical protein C0432_05440 [Candidatus Puniceispirillum sp.]|nr:hypothetical protein [Candidatus Pelagibacter sp.]MBA4283717.1 hypothetical protein [Candidatus Puniceispirillum sp.]
MTSANKKQYDKKYNFSAIIKGMMGNIFEWFQFSIFGFFASQIGQTFFPQNGNDSTLFAYGTFFAGYLARPIGGLIFGYISDKYGRKQVIVWTLLLMAVPSFLIGILPSYKQIGMSASVILIFLRVVQGVSMGGNYGGSLTYIFEQSLPHKKGFLSSLSFLGVLIGLFLGSTTATLLEIFSSPHFMNHYGFRLPFLCGIFALILGLFFRKNLPESQEFRQEKAKSETKVSLSSRLSFHKNTIINLVCVIILHDLSFYILFVYMMSFYTDNLGFGKSKIFAMNSFHMILVAVAVLISAWYSDAIGRIKLMKISALAFLLTTIPIFYFITKTQSFLTVFMLQTCFAIMAGVFSGPLPALMSEVFPMNIRNTGINIAGSISGPVFGGSAPLVLSFLVMYTGSKIAPGIYITLAAFITFVALHFTHINIEEKK